MIKDDYTQRLSLGRVAIALILMHLFSASGWLLIRTNSFIDIPVNWLGLISMFYIANKTASTTLAKGNLNAAGN
jgi:hypothetical protein